MPLDVLFKQLLLLLLAGSVATKVSNIALGLLPGYETSIPFIVGLEPAAHLETEQHLSSIGIYCHFAAAG
jgi:hypothetical protein